MTVIANVPAVATQSCVTGGASPYGQSSDNATCSAGDRPTNFHRTATYIAMEGGPPPSRGAPAAERTSVPRPLGLRASSADLDRLGRRFEPMQEAIAREQDVDSHMPAEQTLSAVEDHRQAERAVVVDPRT